MYGVWGGICQGVGATRLRYTCGDEVYLRHLPGGGATRGAMRGRGMLGTARARSAPPMPLMCSAAAWPRTRVCQGAADVVVGKCAPEPQPRWSASSRRPAWTRQGPAARHAARLVIWGPPRPPAPPPGMPPRRSGGGRHTRWRGGIPGGGAAYRVAGRGGCWVAGRGGPQITSQAACRVAAREGPLGREVGPCSRVER